MLNDHDYKMQTLAVLRKAVANALDRKGRLGQYAVIWRDGRPQRIVPAAQDVSYAGSLPEAQGASEVREADKDDPEQ